MKTIKKSVISIVLALVMIAMPVGDTLALTPVYADTTVYVTRTGSKYHTHKCGNGTYYASTLSAAIARGLTACAKCFGGSSGYSYTSSTSVFCRGKMQVVAKCYVCRLLQSRHWGLHPQTPVKSTDVANQNLHLPHPLILQLPTKWVCNFLYFTFAINTPVHRVTRQASRHIKQHHLN